MKEFLFRLVRPRYWMSSYPISHEWSDTLEKLMDEGAEVKEKHDSSFCIRLGNKYVWIGGYPYAFGQPYGKVKLDVVPRATTRERLFKYIQRNGL